MLARVRNDTHSETHRFINIITYQSDGICVCIHETVTQRSPPPRCSHCNAHAKQTAKAGAFDVRPTPTNSRSMRCGVRMCVVCGALILQLRYEILNIPHICIHMCS